MDDPTENLDALLTASVIDSGFPPGAVIWIGQAGKTLFEKAYGFSQVVPGREKMTMRTVFDLASLTKPLATAMAVMILQREKMLKISDPVFRYLPKFRGRPNGTATLEELLTHTAGLPSWHPLYILDKDGRDRYLSSARIKSRTVGYSCLGYIILGDVITAVTGARLDRFCQSRIFRKARLDHTMFCPGAKPGLAATERGNEHERKKVLKLCRGKKMANAIKWRRYVLRGEAHDGNCYYGYHGVAGNAGLFSNVPDLAKFLNLYINGGIIDLHTVANMTRDHTGRAGPEHFGLGWKIDMYPGILSRTSFGHTGFTGTMICVDPVRELVVVLLTNSVHPRVRLGIMPSLRRGIMGSIADATK